MKPLLFFSYVAILSVSACKPTTSTNLPVLQGRIADSTAKRIVQNFEPRSHRLAQDSANGLLKDTRCVWFPLDQLKSLVSRIDSEGGNGVRFYLAAYDKRKMPDITIDTAYFGYSTLVLVSTRDSVISGKKVHADYFNKRGTILTTVPENQGELCPPPTNCYDQGALLLQ